MPVHILSELFSNILISTAYVLPGVDVAHIQSQSLIVLQLLKYAQTTNVMLHGNMALMPN